MFNRRTPSNPFNPFCLLLTLMNGAPALIACLFGVFISLHDQLQSELFLLSVISINNLDHSEVVGSKHGGSDDWMPA